MKKISENSYISFPSPLDSSYEVYIIFEDHPKYRFYKNIFQKFGNSFIRPETKRIYIDGQEVEKDYFNNDQLEAIQAKQIGHHLFQHDFPCNDDNDDKIANIAGISLLNKMKKQSSSAILGLKFRQKYGISPGEYKIPDDASSLLINYLSNLPGN